MLEEVNMLEVMHRFFRGEASKVQQDNITFYSTPHSYLIVVSSVSSYDFDISAFLAGELNWLYKHNENYKIYKDLGDLLANCKLFVRNKTQNGVYILESPFSLDDVSRAAAEGRINEKIVKAYNYKELIKLGGAQAISEGKITGIDNPYFMKSKLLNGMSPLS
jgi:hypothetical protein